MICIALFAPMLTPYDYHTHNYKKRIAPPSFSHWFGTDEFGRDLFIRVVYGARLSLKIGFLVAIFTAIGGTLIGLVVGYYGKLLDNAVMRIMDALMSYPAILLAIAIMAILGPSMLNVILALIIVYIPRLARIVRGAVLKIRELEYIESSKAIGCSSLRIIFPHILPNALPPTIVQVTITVAYAILAEAALSFLGLWELPSVSTWGNILSDGKNYIHAAPWLTIFPGIFILMTVLSINLLGDGLRDVLDPKLNRLIEMKRE
jgi:peptide/nickel transport system permease protein